MFYDKASKFKYKKIRKCKVCLNKTWIRSESESMILHLKRKWKKSISFPNRLADWYTLHIHHKQNVVVIFYVYLETNFWSNFRISINLSYISQIERKQLNNCTRHAFLQLKQTTPTCKGHKFLLEWNKGNYHTFVYNSCTINDQN